MVEALAAIKVPLLVIQSTTMGANNRRAAIQPGETSPWLDLVRRCAPAARIEILTGLGHFPHLEAPDQVNKLLTGFIKP